MIQGTFGVIQGTFGVIQGTFGVIQGTFGVIQGTFHKRLSDLVLEDWAKMPRSVSADRTL
jgi:hypothetical protein